MNIPFAPITFEQCKGLGPKFLVFTTTPYASGWW